MLNRLCILFILLSSALLSACYEDISVSLHQPGEYKGAVDPLLKTSRDSAHKERLRVRFDMVQTDR